MHNNNNNNNCVLRIVLTLIFVLLCAVFLVNCEIDAEEEIRVKEILAWEAPYEMRRDFPFFLAGQDNDGCPVWVVEYGRWDVRSLMDNGTQIETFNKYILYALYTIVLSTDNYTTAEGDPVEEFQILADLDGYDARQFTHVPSLTRTLNIFRDYLTIEQKHGRRLKQAIGVNLNFLATSVWNLVRHIIGDLANRVQIFGSTESKWLPVLRKEFPRVILPEFLGGYKNFTAIKVYG